MAELPNRLHCRSTFPGEILCACLLLGDTGRAATLCQMPDLRRLSLKGRGAAALPRPRPFGLVTHPASIISETEKSDCRPRNPIGVPNPIKRWGRGEQCPTFLPSFHSVFMTFPSSLRPFLALASAPSFAPFVRSVAANAPRSHPYP